MAGVGPWSRSRNSICKNGKILDESISNQIKSAV